MAVAGDLLLLGPGLATRARVHFRSRFPDSGVVYGIRLDWNTRAFFWTLGLDRVDGTALLNGIAVREGKFDLLGPFVGDDMPAGQLFCEDVEGQGRDPDRDGWRTYGALYYRPPEVVASVAGTVDEVR